MQRTFFWMLCLIVAARSGAIAAPPRYVESDPSIGSSAAVIVEDTALVHTPQLLPSRSGDAAAQLDELFGQLDAALKSAGSDAQHLAKLNFYIVRQDVAQVVRQRLVARFSGQQRPAVSVVVTALPRSDALIALDAVGVTATTAADVKRLKVAAILPSGSRLYVSGQADRAAELREATRKTLEGLTATLKHCGRSNQDIVHLKCFLQPMQSVGEVQEEIAKCFGAEPLPAVSFVEWRSTSPLIEIELVAWGGPANHDAKEPLEFITPTGMTASPVFSRVARIHRGGTIFIGDIASPAAGTADEQLQASFDALRKLVVKTGSDFKHLAKATYYVTDDEISKAHNAIRPKYYDPERPPAASKALVAATGRPGSRYVMDMIAAPSSRGTPASGPEHGRGISAEEAAAGWISLFDGATTFGWNESKVEVGVLRGGTSTTTFGRCELRGEFAGQGSVAIGDQEVAVSGGKPLVLKSTTGHGPIRLGQGASVKSLTVRPLELRPLFNGHDMGGWKTIERTGPIDGPSRFWRVEEGVLRAVGGPGAIEYDRGMFGDFVLQIDVRSRAVHSNGGVFLRSVPGQFMNGYEAQLHNKCLEDDPSKPSRYCTGGLDDRQDARRLVSRDFEPFRMTVIATGPHIATWVNGLQVTDWTDDRAPHDNPRQGQRLTAGTLQLQAHDPATDYEVRQVLVAEW
jgi:enamine deaminase RidA (YjgF/YER057c/UK114 family)